MIAIFGNKKQKSKKIDVYFLAFYMGTILVTVYRDISYFIPLFQSFERAIFIISVPNISNFPSGVTST